MSSNPWSGLGKRASAPPPTGSTYSASDDDFDAFEQPPVQRNRIAAASAAPGSTSPFNLGFRLSGSAAEDASELAAEDQPEEKPMPMNTDAPAPRRNIQRQICAQLTQGKLTRDELASQLLALDTKQLSQGLFQVNQFGRAKKVGDAWQLTPAGRAYVANKPFSLSDPAPAPKKARRAQQGKKVRSAPASTAQFTDRPGTALAVAAFEPVVERSFRCAVFSDGGFHMAKNGQQVDLTPAEHAEMLRYLERMAEQPGR
jgi:hypothetical protein